MYIMSPTLHCGIFISPKDQPQAEYENGINTKAGH